MSKLLVLKMIIIVILLCNYYIRYTHQEVKSDPSTIDLIEERKKWPYLVLIIITPSAFMRSGTLISPELVLTTADNINNKILPLVFVNVIDALPYAIELKNIKERGTCSTVNCFIEKFQHLNESPLIKMILTEQIIYSNATDIVLLKLKYMAKLVANWNYANLAYGKLKKGTICHIVHWGYRFPFEINAEKFMVVLATEHKIFYLNNDTTNDRYIYSTGVDGKNNYFEENNIFFVIGGPLICNGKQYGVVADLNDLDAQTVRLTPYATWIIRHRILFTGKVKYEPEVTTEPKEDDDTRSNEDSRNNDQEETLRYKKLIIPPNENHKPRSYYYSDNRNVRDSASFSGNIQFCFMYIITQIYFMINI